MPGGEGVRSGVHGSGSSVRDISIHVSAVTKQTLTEAEGVSGSYSMIGSCTKARVWVATSLANVISATPVCTFAGYDANLTGLTDLIYSCPSGSFVITSRISPPRLFV
jgi:hypothetical protein